MTSHAPQNIRPRALLITWSVAALVLALIITGYALAQAEGATYQNTLKASDYLLKERTAYRSLINMETSERGYVVSGKESFLGPYNDAVQQLPALWDYLSSKTQDVDPDSVRRSDLAGLVADLRAKAQIWQTQG